MWYRSVLPLFLSFWAIIVFTNSQESLAAPFVVQGEVVIDERSGMTWQQDTADVNGDQAIDRHDRLSWEEADLYCKSLDLAGYDDWHLPTYEALESIVDYNAHSPAIEPLFKAENSTYWTQSAYTPAQDRMWVISFLFGDDYFVDRNSRHLVRCQRP